jgi:hypothetical protein
MHIIQNNPYRTVGLLVGATAREQERQVKRLKQFIEAEQDPQDDFSFPTFGNLHRTLDKVNEAASKLNLDSDKMSSALFWFYKGNPITDEPAFDAIKEADLDQVINIWTKLTSNGEVSQRNASAYSNLGTLYLSGILELTNTNEVLLEKGISLKLKFLESDFINDFKALVTGETYKTTKKELQLLFLNQIQTEIENNGVISSNKFLEILSKKTFSAKDDFLKEFVQKPIDQIEKKIEEIRKKQKANAAKAGEFGNELYNTTKPLLTTIISILSKSDIKVISISDKIANEILQCGINLFNHFHETETEVGEIALDLNIKAKSIALGSVVKERINESTPIVKRYIKDRPEREKLNKIKEEFEFITNKINSFQSLNDTVSNAKSLITNCKPKLTKIKKSVGANDELYISLSSSIVHNAQNMVVQAVNENLEEYSNSQFSRFSASTYSIKALIAEALDVSFNLGTFDMNSQLKTVYKKNLDGLKALAEQLSISTLSPKEKLQKELSDAERKLKEIQNQTFLQSEISNCKSEMNKIKEWQFLRSQVDKDREINTQQQKIDNLLKRSELEKRSQISIQNSNIENIKTKIKNAEC